MDRATIRPEIPESLMTDCIIHNEAGTDLTISALYHSGTNGEGVTELKVEGSMTNSVVNEEKMGGEFIDPSPGRISGLVVIAPQEDNYHKYEAFQTNGKTNAPDHEEEIEQETSIPAVKQEIMDVDIKEEETGDISMEEIYNNQITEEEMQDCKKSIKLEDGMNLPCVDNLNKMIKTEGQSDELYEEEPQEDFLESERFDGDLGQSDDHALRKIGEPRNQPRTVKTTSSDGGSDYENDNSKNDSQIDNKQEVYSGQNYDGDARIKSPSDNRSHQCDICGKYYVHGSSLKIHLRQIHQMYCCDYCDSKFIQLIDYEAHLLKPNTNTNNKCTKCDKTFMCMSEVLVHSFTHIGKKPYQCTICDESFSVQLDLKIHHRTHTGEKPYACTMCNKSFRNKSDLLHHQRTHRREKPYGCTMCEKSFSTLSHLKLHLRTHTGEKPYGCTMCDKCFSDRSNLKVHQRTHIVEKPYECTMCDKSFIYKSSHYSIKEHTQGRNLKDVN